MAKAFRHHSNIQKTQIHDKISVILIEAKDGNFEAHKAALARAHEMLDQYAAQVWKWEQVTKKQKQ